MERVSGDSSVRSSRYMLAGRMNTQIEREMLQSAESFPKGKYPGKEENALRTLRLNVEKPNEAVNDLLKGIAVSDSAAIRHNALMVTRKTDLKYGSDVYSEGKMPLFRECLKPDTQTRFTISPDTRIFPLRCFDELKKALVMWDRTLEERYAKRFDIATDDRACADDEYPITLGAGAGFQQKTLLYAVRNPNDAQHTAHTVLRTQFKTYKQFPDSAYPAPYCLKLAPYRSGYYPYGRCALRIDK